MKIDNRKTNKNVIDFNEIIAKYSEVYDVIHHVQICEQDFVYKVLGRKEFNKILSLDISDMEKEDMICKTCMLYPEEYDFDECEAGIPSMLCETILENSFLDGVDSTLRLITHFEEEMETLEHQMYCIISEAFPNYTLDEIESWNNIRFCKMFTRAQWKLSNLRGLQVNDLTQYLEAISELDEQGADFEEINEKMKNFSNDNTQDNQTVFKSKEQDSNISKKGKQKLTPEKLRELEEMKRKFPEINWGADEILNHGVDDVMKNMDSISTVSPALRPGWGK